MVVVEAEQGGELDMEYVSIERSRGDGRASVEVSPEHRSHVAPIVPGEYLVVTSFHSGTSVGVQHRSGTDKLPKTTVAEMVTLEALFIDSATSIQPAL